MSKDFDFDIDFSDSFSDSFSDNTQKNNGPPTYENTKLDNDPINSRILAIINTCKLKVPNVIFADADADTVADTVADADVDTVFADADTVFADTDADTDVNMNATNRRDTISNNIGFGISTPVITSKETKVMKPYEYEEEEIFVNNNVEVCEVLSKTFPKINFIPSGQKTIESISIANCIIALGTGYKVKSVKKISCESSEIMFRARQKASNNDKTCTTYHGTTEKNAISICKKGYFMQTNKRELYGKGIYSTPLFWMAISYAMLHKNKDDEKSITQTILVNDCIDGSKGLGTKGQEDYGDNDILTDENQEIYCVKTADMLQVKYIITLERNMNDEITELQKSNIRFFETVVWILNNRIVNAKKANIKLNIITWDNMYEELWKAGTNLLFNAVVDPVIDPSFTSKFHGNCPCSNTNLSAGAGRGAAAGAAGAAGVSRGAGSGTVASRGIVAGRGIVASASSSIGVSSSIGTGNKRNYQPLNNFIFNKKEITVGQKIKILDVYMSDKFNFAINQIATIEKIFRTYRAYIFVKFEDDINDRIININNSIKNKKGFPYFKDINIDQKESWIVIPIQVGYFELIDSGSGSSSGSASTSVSISESASKKQKI